MAVTKVAERMVRMTADNIVILLRKIEVEEVVEGEDKSFQLDRIYTRRGTNQSMRILVSLLGRLVKDRVICFEDSSSHRSPRTSGLFEITTLFPNQASPIMVIR
jgi:hypothetical protein